VKSLKNGWNKLIIWSNSRFLLSIDKANIIEDCSENQSTPHDLYDYDHKRQIEARVKVLLAAVGKGTLVKFQPCLLNRCPETGLI
jgi:hypothetical protein